MNFRERPFTTEVRLLVECCRWTFAGGDSGPVEKLAGGVDWHHFVTLSRRHRVQGLIWNCLRKLEVPMPAETAAVLSEDASAVAQHNLRAARQSDLLLNAFTQAGIPLIFIKGLTLGKLAYGDPFLKMGWDVDVLIPADALESAIAELQRLDFRLIIPATNARSHNLLKWHRRRKESVWRSPDGLYVELHTRLADSSELIPSIGIGSPCQHVAIAPGISLPTLVFEDLFAYLCVHGASSAWFRLKWLTDLAALLHKCAPSEIENLYYRSQELGAGRAADQALILASHFYGVSLGSSLDERLNGRAVSRWLAAAARAQMMREGEPTQARFGTVSIHLTQLFLLPGVRYKIEEAARQLRDWTSLVR